MTNDLIHIKSYKDFINESNKLNFDDFVDDFDGDFFAPRDITKKYMTLCIFDDDYTKDEIEQFTKGENDTILNDIIDVFSSFGESNFENENEDIYVNISKILKAKKFKIDSKKCKYSNIHGYIVRIDFTQNAF